MRRISLSRMCHYCVLQLNCLSFSIPDDVFVFDVFLSGLLRLRVSVMNLAAAFITRGSFSEHNYGDDLAYGDKIDE